MKIMKNIVIKRKNTYYCGRCGNSDFEYFGDVNNNTYCRKCIDYGKVGVNSKEELLKIENKKEMKRKILTRRLILSKSQKDIALKLLKDINNKKHILVWAVCGAGKTEMMYPLLVKLLKQRKKIGWAIPRKDVVIELGQRFDRDFNNIKISYLYGGSKDSINGSDLYVLTTHQLVKFNDYFDVIIIDEVDAFPYRRNDMLDYFTNRSLKEDGKIVMLSATPEKEQIKLVSKKLGDMHIVPVRYHGYPIPIPKMVNSCNWYNKLKKGYLHTKIKRIIAKQYKDERKTFIFVSEIKIGYMLEKVMKGEGYSCEFVNSQDNNKLNKIKRFKDSRIAFLITTIILERGITIPNTDVIVIGTEHHIFTESSLVQIAGRVGRSRDYPQGLVCFIFDEINFSIINARDQIKYMNKLALKRGLL